MLGARPGHLERHGVRPSGVEFDVPRVEVPVEHFGHAIVEVGDVAVERHGHECDNLRHCDVPFEGGDCVQGTMAARNLSLSVDSVAPDGARHPAARRIRTRWDRLWRQSRQSAFAERRH